jgi:hypothetical protein
VKEKEGVQRRLNRLFQQQRLFSPATVIGRGIASQMFSRWIRLSILTCVSLMLIGTVSGQNRATLQQLYGSPIGGVYQTSSRLIVTPQFAPNGNLCNAYIGAATGRMTDGQLDPVLNELAPIQARGEHKIDDFLDRYCGPDIECSGVSYDYAHLTITKIGNTNSYSSASITYRRRGCKALSK